LGGVIAHKVIADAGELLAGLPTGTRVASRELHADKADIFEAEHGLVCSKKQRIAGGASEEVDSRICLSAVGLEAERQPGIALPKLVSARPWLGAASFIWRDEGFSFC